MQSRSFTVRVYFRMNQFIYIYDTQQEDPDQNVEDFFYRIISNQHLGQYLNEDGEMTPQQQQQWHTDGLRQTANKFTIRVYYKLIWVENLSPYQVKDTKMIQLINEIIEQGYSSGKFFINCIYFQHGNYQGTDWESKYTKFFAKIVQKRRESQKLETLISCKDFQFQSQDMITELQKQVKKTISELQKTEKQLSNVDVLKIQEQKRVCLTSFYKIIFKLGQIVVLQLFLAMNIVILEVYELKLAGIAINLIITLIIYLLRGQIEERYFKKLLGSLVWSIIQMSDIIQWFLQILGLILSLIIKILALVIIAFVCCCWGNCDKIRVCLKEREILKLKKLVNFQAKLPERRDSDIAELGFRTKRPYRELDRNSQPLLIKQT